MSGHFCLSSKSFDSIRICLFLYYYDFPLIIGLSEEGNFSIGFCFRTNPGILWFGFTAYDQPLVIFLYSMISRIFFSPLDLYVFFVSKLRECCPLLVLKSFIIFYFQIVNVSIVRLPPWMRFISVQRQWSCEGSIPILFDRLFSRIYDVQNYTLVDYSSSVRYYMFFKFINLMYKKFHIFLCWSVSVVIIIIVIFN